MDATTADSSKRLYNTNAASTTFTNRHPALKSSEHCLSRSVTTSFQTQMSKISNSDTEESLSEHISTIIGALSSEEGMLQTALSRIPSQVFTLVMGIAFFSVAVGPAAAQTGVG